jgi:superfamily II DNA or RNA helicase
MRLIAHNLWTYVHGTYPVGLLDPPTSFRQPGCWFSPAYKKGFWDGKIRFMKFDRQTNMWRFPTGLLQAVCDFLDGREYRYELADCRDLPVVQPKFVLHDDEHGEIRLDEGKYDYQAEAVAAAVSSTRGVIKIATGGGKCLGEGTPVLLADGRVLPVEHVVVGDWVMGPDSLPRRVARTTSGKGPLYRVSPKKGISYVVNENHVLMLVLSGKDEVVAISVADYLRQNKTFKHIAKGFSVGVDWPHRRTALEPYFFGLWLAEGESTSQVVYAVEPEVIRYLHEYASALGIGLSVYESESGCHGYCLTNGRNGGLPNPVVESLRPVLGRKRIPDEYKINSRCARLELLAGVLEDAELHRNGNYKIYQKSAELADDIAFVARSCGFAAYVKPEIKTCTNTGATGEYWGISIIGDVSQIPVKTARKISGPRVQKKNPLRTGISVSPIGVGDYFGFELEGPDGRFLLGDFTVTHNSEIGAAIIKSVGGQWAWITHRTTLLHQTRRRLQQRLQIPVGILGDQEAVLENVTVCMAQTLEAVFKRSGREHVRDWCRVCRGIIGDEIHHLESDQWFGAFGQFSAVWRFGLTATPPKPEAGGMYLQAMTGSVLIDIPASDLIARGVLTPPRIWFVPVNDREYPDPPTPAGQKKKNKLTWQQLYKPAIVENEYRNRRIAEVAKIFQLEGKPTLIVVRQIGHGKNILRCLKDSGIPAGWVHGKVPQEKRDELFSQLWQRELAAIVAVSECVGEGVDLPELGAAINATGTSGGGSTKEEETGRVTIQVLGRGLRRCAGKKFFDYVDFVDSGHKMLQRATLARVETLENEGYANSIRYWEDYKIDR